MAWKQKTFSKLFLSPLHSASKMRTKTTHLFWNNYILAPVAAGTCSYEIFIISVLLVIFFILFWVNYAYIIPVMFTKAFIMSKVSLCPHENINWSGIYKPPDGIGDGLCVKDLTCPLSFPPSVLMKKWTCREISRGMCPTVIKLKIVFILIAQAYGSVSNDDAVVSNS